jgi:cytochrome c oxidase subunit I+III
VNILISFARGERAGDDPWAGETLEWATTSPPQVYNFAVIPTIHSRSPLWEPVQPPSGPQPTYGVRPDRRETIGTSTMDGNPEQRLLLPGPSIWPFVAAMTLGFAFIGSIFTLWAVPIGAFLTFIALVAWNWPLKEGEP